MGRGWLTVAIAVLGVAGCSSTSGPTDAGVREPALPRYAVLDEAALAQLLLPLAAMPSGFAVSPSPDADAPTKYYCDYDPPYEDQFTARRDFQKGSGVAVELAAVSIRQYETAEQSAAAFDALVTTLATCTTDTVDGEAVSYARVDVEPVGERTLGILIEGASFSVQQTFALVGPVMVTAGGGGFLGADTELHTAVLQQQVQRYVASAETLVG